MMQQQLQKYDYYARAYIGHLLRECSEGREVAILPLARALQIRSLNELNSILDWSNWNKKKSSMYISCAKLKNIPNFTFNARTRSDSTSKWFAEEFDSQVYEYDLFFDFDSDEITESVKEAKILVEVLREFQAPYQVIFSGNRGVHVVVDGKYVPIHRIEVGCVYPHKTLIENIKEALELECLDLAHCGIVNKLKKLPYSLVLPKDAIPGTTPESLMRVALPLSNNQLNSFSINDMLSINVLKKVKLIRRGNLERFNNLSLEQKKKNVQNLIREFGA